MSPWSGRLFLAVGPTTDKEQAPNFIENRWTCNTVVCSTNAKVSYVVWRAILQCFVDDQAQLVGDMLGTHSQCKQ